MTIIEAVNLIIEKLGISEKEAVVILNKAIAGGEIKNDEIENWVSKRFLPNIVFIQENDYAKMCIDALKILGKTAPTDFGGSRQRDIAQLWADMTRGYLGEQALIQFLEQKFKILSKLAHEKGNLQDYLPMDIKQIKKRGDDWRTPKLKIGIKTTKWNGIWFDIPGAQFSHSDIHVLIKIGAARDHLFAFFKTLSIFKDKILKKGVELRVLDKIEAEDLYNELPSFKPIPAYICGYVASDKSYDKLSYRGRKGKIHYTINSWNGPIFSNDIADIRQRENINGQIKFLAIGNFAHDSGYLFNSGNLLWEENDWNNLIKKL